jgi:YD repeat-containing protein
MARLASVVYVLGSWQALVGVCVAAALLVGSPARAADVEIRDFTLWVDGKRGGEYHMTINRADDGSVSMTGQADVRLSFAFGLKVYTYTYRGTEVWKDNRLVRLDSSSDDDGKRFTVSAVPVNNGVRVTANGQEHMSRTDLWLTTYWHLPDPKQRNGALPLLDADTGKDINATLQYAGEGQLNLAGQARKVTRYRLTGGVQIELWYDDQERLVREDWVEDGRRCTLELARIRR